MTTTEQIVWAHRVDKPMSRGDVRARAPRCASTPTCCRRRTAPRRSRFTRSIRSPAARRSFRARRRSPTTTSCSRARTRTRSRRRSAARSRRCTASRSRTTRRRATASFISISPSRGSCCPASSFPAPIRTAAPTARTAPSASASDRRRSASAGRPATSTSRWRKPRRVVFTGRLNPWVGGKDIVLELLRRWGAKQSQGMSVEFVDRDRQLPMVSRNTIANMMAEAEALNGIFAPDDVTLAWYARQGHRRICRIRRSRPARTRCTRSTRRSISRRRRADDRQAVQPGQRVSGRRGRARAD